MAVAQALGAHDEVGLDAVLLDAEPLAARAAPARLHLVRDVEGLVPLHDLGHDLRVLLRRHDEPAHAHDRLRDVGGRPARGRRADHVLDVAGAGGPAALGLHAQRTAIAVRRHGVPDGRILHAPEPPVRVRGERHREHAAAVVAVAQGDDLGALGVQARGEDGGLDGLGAAVGEEHLGRALARKDLLEGLRQLHDGDGGEEGGDVLERARLLLDRVHHPRMAVAEGDGHDPAEEIQIAAAAGIGEPLALALHEGQRLPVVRGQTIEVLAILVVDLVGVHL